MRAESGGCKWKEGTFRRHIQLEKFLLQNEYIGVENLMGYGAIGEETSRAYREIPTYCYVTGRSVCIGAYAARHWMRYLLVKQSEFPFFKCLANSSWALEEFDVSKEEMQLNVQNVIKKAGKQGTFDNGYFYEICFSWAASIVTGRAKLDGLTVGIIASQWKLFEKTQLAAESVEKGRR